MFSQASVRSHLLGGGYPITGPDGGGVTPSQVWTGEATPSQVQMGYPILLTGGYPIPNLDGWVPHPADREVPPSKIRMGGTSRPGRRAVCLLRSRRRTFLLIMSSWYFKSFVTFYFENGILLAILLQQNGLNY